MIFGRRLRSRRRGKAGPRKTCLMLGAGGMAQVWIKTLTDSFGDRVEIVALCDRDPEILRKQGRRLSLSDDHLFTDLERAISEVRADFCAVVIPQSFHAPAATAAMRRGMAVLCEKPIADDLDGALEMVEVSHSTGMPCAITQQFRYQPNKLELVRIRDEERLGRLQHVVARYADDHRKYFSEARPHRRLLGDGSVHHFDMLRFLCGADCELVTGSTWNPEWSSFDHDSSAFYLLEMTNGVRATLELNGSGTGLTTNWHSHYRAEFEHGTVEVIETDRVTIHRGDRKPKSYRAPAMEWTGHEYLFAEFLDWLDGGTPSASRIEDNIRSFALTIAAEDATIEGGGRRVADYLGASAPTGRTAGDGLRDDRP